MPFTAAQIAKAGKASLDSYTKNTTIDQIATERPLLKTLVAKKKPFPGGKQYIVEKLRTNYGSNFQWYRGAQAVTYNSRDTLMDANFPWGGFHDGFEIDEDELFQNGIVITDDDKDAVTATDAEKIQLVDLLKEQMESLSMGLEQALDRDLHRSGTANPEGITGLDALVSLAPATGVIGGIDRAANVWWRNYAAKAVAATSLLDTMEKMWRACARNGGAPDIILMGSDAIDAYAAAVGEKKQIVVQAGSEFTVEGGNTGHTFKGVKIFYDPVFEDLDLIDAPADKWVKRIYFLNSKNLKLRPADQHWMVARKPERVSTAYVHRFALTGKMALTMNRANAHGVMTIA